MKRKLTRRQALQRGAEAVAALSFLGTLPAESRAAVRVPLLLDASGVEPAPAPEFFQLGTATAPDGQTLQASQTALYKNGKPWLAVMGEFHYARYPAEEWETELRKMKAHGISIVSTYVFWIHHEEERGVWDWSGRRELSHFLQLCKKTGLLAVVRCGPWCHGEVRNGGFPDWVQHSGLPLRSTDPRFLALVRPLYAQIAAQMKGHLWKEGGPVIGIQADNEYGGPADYLLALKKMATASGMDVPLYTRTGWPALSTPMPPGELLPLFGAYADGFWNRRLTAMPDEYRSGFFFQPARTSASAALGAQVSKSIAADNVGNYPYFCCEIGGGMMTSYHRRIRVQPNDVCALALAKLGSGSCLQGYYMFHGGTNPDGRLSTLQETQRTGGWNDLPVKTYDFQTSLGEFGQTHPQHNWMRLLHLFLQDWGEQLALQPALLPEKQPRSSGDNSTLRWSVRTNGSSGVLFVNNFECLTPLPKHSDVQFSIKLPSGALSFPSRAVAIPADSMGFFAFGLHELGAEMLYGMAQPVCRMEDEEGVVLVFAALEGIPAEFAFGKRTGAKMETRQKYEEHADRWVFSALAPGLQPALQITTSQGVLRILLLSPHEAARLYRVHLQGRSRLALCSSSLWETPDGLEFETDEEGAGEVALWPAPPLLHHAGKTLNGQAQGIFTSYRLKLAHQPAAALQVHQIRQAGPVPLPSKGAAGVAESPREAEFAHAAAWKLRLPDGISPDRHLMLRVHYQGDVARLSVGGRLLTDNFYNGNPFEIGLYHFGPDAFSKPLLLEILPLRPDAPIYLPADAWPDFGGKQSAALLHRIEVVERRRAALV